MKGPAVDGAKGEEREKNIMIQRDPLKTFFASFAARLEKRFSFTYMVMAA